MKKILSLTMSVLMIAVSVPFSTVAAEGDIDLGSVTGGNVGGGFDFGNMGGNNGGFDFGNMGGNNGGFDFGNMGGNNGGFDFGNMGGNNGGFDFGNMGGNNGGFDFGNMGGNNGGFDFGNMGGNNGGFDFGNMGGNNGGFDFGNTNGQQQSSDNTENNISKNENVIKIMPAGDSITFGMGDTGGYRKYLDYFLKEKGYNNFDFVGPEGKNSASFNYNGKSVTYDDNHAGYSGYTIKQNSGFGSLYDVLKQKNAIKQAQPDIVLLIIGTNDMNGNRATSACEQDLRDLVDYILTDMPSDGMLFLSTIPELGGGMFGGGGDRSAQIASYNAAVKKVAEEYKSNGKRVTFADIHGCLNGTADLGDGVHPNAVGYEKMGKYWAGVIDEYLKTSKPITTTATTTITSTTTTTTKTTTPAITTSVDFKSELDAKVTKWGDANNDGALDMSDVVAIMQSLANPNKYKLNGSGIYNADVYEAGSGITSNDALTIQKYLLGLVKTLPESYSSNVNTSEQITANNFTTITQTTSKATTTTTKAKTTTEISGTTTTTTPSNSGRNLNADIRKDMPTSVPGGNEAKGCKVEKKTYNCKFTGGQKSCNVVLPPNYDPSKKYPVMYVLHGIGGDEGSMVNGMGVQELMAGLIGNGKAEEMIIVLPSQFTSKNGSQGGGFGINQATCEAYDNFLYDISDSLIPFIEANYPVKTGRENRAITGFSMGGREAIYIGLMRPDLFAYVGGACPAPGITPGKDMFMEHPGCMTESEMKFRDVGPEPNVFMITGGTNDSVVGTFPKSYSDILTRNGVDHVYQSIPGGGHGADSVKPHLYTFMRYAFK